MALWWQSCCPSEPEVAILPRDPVPGAGRQIFQPHIRLEGAKRGQRGSNGLIIWEGWKHPQVGESVARRLSVGGLASSLVGQYAGQPAGRSAGQLVVWAAGWPAGPQAAGSFGWPQ